MVGTGATRDWRSTCPQPPADAPDDPVFRIWCENSMADKHSDERRRRLVVNKPLQSRLIASVALVPALGLALIAVLTAVWCMRMMDEAMASDAELPNLMPLFAIVIVFEVLAGAALMTNSLKMSHKVAGPSYRICKSIERIRGGDIAFTVSLRDGDHLGEIRDELNKLLDWLNENPPSGVVTRTAAAAAKAAAEIEAGQNANAVDACPSLVAAPAIETTTADR